MLRYWFLMFITLATFASPIYAAERALKGARETLACRLGDEDRHARIAVVLIGGKTQEFAYYSKWKPRTCSIYVQRSRDSHSKWADTGQMTSINLAEGKGDVLIEHKKGEYRFVFKNIDRERYCGMDGQINGHLIIKKGSDRCELAGVMDEGTKLGEAWIKKPGEEDPPPAAAVAGAAGAAGASGATGDAAEQVSDSGAPQIPAPKSAY